MYKFMIFYTLEMIETIFMYIIVVENSIWKIVSNVFNQNFSSK